MEQRQLGHSSLSVPALGLGCMSMSGTYGKQDDAQSIDVVHRAIDLGVNFLDSSDMYGFGHNEELLGRAIRGRRHQVVMATKLGQVRTPDGKATARRITADFLRAHNITIASAAVAQIKAERSSTSPSIG